MSRAPRIILVVYLVTVAAACVYVPWMRTGDFQQKFSLGYSALWVPWQEFSDASSVDLDRVFLELLAASALAGVAVVLFGCRPGDQP